jgi:NAD(P)-dependent dehydrogenase (short-subunit alcohol dehydrogenase family)
MEETKVLRFRKKKSSRRGLWLAGLGTGFVLAAGIRWMLRERKREDFFDQVVIITGGSRGLGLEMARLLAEEGARLALLARNEPELEAARRELEEMGADVQAILCDVTDREQVERAVDQVVQRFGRVDALINNAGIVQVSPLDHVKLEDFEVAMAVHFWGPLYAMMRVIPIMRRQGKGRIINITSIGGKVAVPHLAPYDASKFAIVGLSDAFRAELDKDGIQVTTVAPGLMRTGSYYHGNFKGQNEEEFAWFSAMASSPLMAMHSERAARQVLRAAHYGTSKVTITFQARMLALVEELFPNITAWLMKRFNQMLPDPAPVAGDEVRTGFESRSKVAPSGLTKLGDKAAEKNNELLAEGELYRKS